MDISVASFVIVLLATCVSLHFVPLYTRPDLYFGATVAPAFRRTEPALRILRNYRVTLWCLTVVAIAVVSAYGHGRFILFGYLASVCAALASANHEAKKHKVEPSTSIEVDLAAPTEQIPGGLVAVLLPLFFLLCVGTLAVSYARATPSAVVMPLVGGGISCVLLTAIAFGVLYSSRRISASGPAAANERAFRHRILLSLIACEYLLVLLATLSVLDAPRVVIVAFQAAAGIAVAAYVVTLIRSGQGGTRLSTEPNVVIGDRSPDNCWKGGLLYFNHRDPAIFVEKRMGIGYTLNFGSLWAWLLLGSILAVPWALHLLRPLAPTAQAISPGTASPGTEDSLRRYIVSLESGQPNYDEMVPTLAAGVTQQLPAIMAAIRKLGDFKSIAYEGVDRNGSDVYETAFEHGHLEWHIAPLTADGKVTGRSFRQLD